MLRERSQMTSSSYGGGLGKDDVVTFYMILEKISNNLILKSWFYLE